MKQKKTKAFNLKVTLYGEIERYKVYNKPFNIPNNKGNNGIRGMGERDRTIKEAVRRSKNKIYNIIMANNFEYWATQTFNNKVVDRYNLDEIIKKYNKKLYNLKYTKYNNLKWLIVPEEHKDGAYHLHMLISGIPKEKIIYSGYDYYNKEKNYSRKVYNWIDTINYGFNDYVYIGDIEILEKIKIASYITKYITKDLADKRFNRKMFWTSKGLKKPTEIKALTTNIDDIINNDKLLISHNNYYIKDNDGNIINSVDDYIYYNDLQF